MNPLDAAITAKLSKGQLCYDDPDAGRNQTALASRAPHRQSVARTTGVDAGDSQPLGYICPTLSGTSFHISTRLMKRLQQLSAYLNQVFIIALLIVVYLTAGLVTALMLHLSELLRQLTTNHNPTSTWRRFEAQHETDFTLPY